MSASVVDVPGHEAFVRNMVAGATGVDVALLVVAADEGVMPQTTEDLAILRFLGVTQGVVALTKCDAAPDPAWRELVAEDVRALVRDTIGADWPVVEVSGVTGVGLEALRATLRGAATGAAMRPDDDRFRMPVDRVFALAGAGTIVTGTVWSGSGAEGDRVARAEAAAAASAPPSAQAPTVAAPGRPLPAPAVVAPTGTAPAMGAPAPATSAASAPALAAVAVLDAVPAGDPVEEQVVAEVRTALRGRTIPELAAVIPAGPAAVEAAARALVARGVFAQRGPRFFMS